MLLPILSKNAVKKIRCNGVQRKFFRLPRISCGFERGFLKSVQAACHISGAMKGKIFYEGKEFHFPNLFSLSIQAGGKAWVYDKHTETELKFKLAELGGSKGIGNYLKAWRKRRAMNQTEAAKLLGVSQSFVTKIERGERNMPKEIFFKIRQDNLKYGKAKPWGK